MQDVLLVAAVLAASTAVGYPACLLFPAARFRARFVAAPPIGFAVLSAAISMLYPFGVSPRMSLMVMSVLGALTAAVHVVREHITERITVSRWSLALGVATAAVVLLCLLPAWIGGPQFAVFQGNVYDHLTYLRGSVIFQRHDYASLFPAAQGQPASLIPADAQGSLNWPISIVHAAFAGIAHSTAASSTYAFMVALQVNMLFSALFVAINVFDADYRVSLLVAAALTVGFFQQYVFDIGAWAQIAAQPIYLLAVAIAVLAFDPQQFGTAAVARIARLAGLFGLLMTSVTLYYPYAAAIYCVAAAAAAGIGVMTARSYKTTIAALAGLALGMAAALAMSYRYGTIRFPFLDTQTTAALGHRDWWQYFQRYLLGREQDYLANWTGRADASWRVFLDSLFSLPVESIIAAIGLYYVLPTAGWPVPLAIIWKLFLYLLVVVVFAGAARVLIAAWREDPASNRTRMMGACLACCLVPIAILIAGRYWLAGKALSMAAPLLFFLIAAPLLCAHAARPLVQAASLIVVLCHLALGALRPAMVADPSGATMPGLPGSATKVRQEKAGMDWQVDRWAALFRICNGIILDVHNPFMNRFAQLVAIDIGKPWASFAAAHPLSLPRVSSRSTSRLATDRLHRR